jgi:hypothetical protein
VTLDLLAGSYAICRLSADTPVPSWASRAAFSSTTRTSNELSIVCASEDVPPDVQAQRGYRGLVVRGPLDFNLVGILASLAGPLAAASVSVFAVSTFDTDYLFVRESDLHRAIAALRNSGHIVVGGLYPQNEDG